MTIVKAISTLAHVGERVIKSLDRIANALELNALILADASDRALAEENIRVALYRRHGLEVMDADALALRAEDQAQGRTAAKPRSRVACR